MASTLHPDIQRQLVGSEDILARVERAANDLADLMQEIHGKTWRVQIEHEEHVALILIAPRNEKQQRKAPVDKSNNGGN